MPSTDTGAPPMRRSEKIKARQTREMRPLDIDDGRARSLLRNRPKDAHKGTMGHAVLFAGSYGMSGAAILSGRSCLRSGAGKLTCFTEPSTYPILQACIPEAIFEIREPGRAVLFDGLPGYAAAGVGPGWGQTKERPGLLKHILSSGIPMVLDADALNLMASHPDILEGLPAHTVLTPHRAEYERLFGADADPAAMAERHGCVLVMKGPNTLIHAPDGSAFRNTTGNPGMATAGSGDVLTGIILGLLARGYAPREAACLGVFLHGRSGDLAISSIGQESLISSDLIAFLGPAFLSIRPYPI